WQLFGYGRSDRSTKLTRGLTSKTAAGFRSRRELSYDDSAPVSPHNAPFSTYKTARVHDAARRRGGGVAARGARAAAGDAGDRVSRQQIIGWHDKPSCFIPPRPERGRTCRGRERHDHLPLGPKIE